MHRSEGPGLERLVDSGALAPTHGWSHQFVGEFCYPQVLVPFAEAPHYPVAAAFDCGGAGTQGLLTAFDQGLGACWTAFDPEPASKLLQTPDDWVPLYVMNVGYPLESEDAGGQRPRPEFESLYFEGNANTPFQRDPAVVKQLEDAKMFTTPAPSPNPERMKEIREMAKKLDLPI